MSHPEFSPHSAETEQVHDGGCMCPYCHAERMAYCALTRRAEAHQDHRIPSCPVSGTALDPDIWSTLRGVE